MEHRIGLYSYTAVNNGGQLEESYALDSTVWGQVMQARGNNAIDAARLNQKQTIRVGLRDVPLLDSRWRVTYEGQTYAIVHVDRTERRRTGRMWLTCEQTGGV